MQILARTMNEIKSTDAPAIIAHWEKGAKFDVLKTREGYFRAYDHQLMHEMYAVEALRSKDLKNRWDIYKPSDPVPGPNESLEVIAATKEENVCNMPA
jgi:branched-chain amino acid transport system substrate-binding protein